MQIVTGVTTLDESGPRYRGHDVAELARTCTYEQVAELLWTGSLPADRRVAGAATGRRRAWPRRVTAAVGGGNGVPAMVADGQRARRPPPGRRPAGGGAPAARRRADRARRARRSTVGGVGGAPRRVLGVDAVAPLAPALDRALVLLADHELATSTLAVRVAGSTWTGPYPAFAAGLATVQGALHGGAARQVHELLVECERDRRGRRGRPAAAGARAAARVRAQDLPGRGSPAGARCSRRSALLPDPARPA